MTRFLAAAIVVALAVTSSESQAARLKDIAGVRGVRDNMLLGYGLVVGLSGTGDSEQVLFTVQSVSGLLGRLGVRVAPQDIRMRNVAAVMVTARLPAFARPGTHLDVSVASMGNARSLAGGVLLLTPLQGPDGRVYALSQGEVQVGGFDAAVGGSAIRKNQATSGRVPSGAIIERSVQPVINGTPIMIDLHRPDFSTSQRTAAAINQALGAAVAFPVDAAAIEVRVPKELAGRPVELISRIESLEVQADGRARVVISERTGTLVAGEGVRLRPAAVAHGGLQVTITSQPVISQPGAFSSGTTVQDRQTTVQANEERRSVVALEATTTVSDLARALNALGASPRDLISILQALKAAGALDAELEVM